MSNSKLFANMNNGLATWFCYDNSNFINGISIEDLINLIENSSDFVFSKPNSRHPDMYQF